MKFTSTSLLAFLSLLFTNQIFSQPVDINKAKMVGMNHLASVNKTVLKSGRTGHRTRQLEVRAMTSSSSDTLYYVLNDSIDHSFVIVAGDERAWPIIGYSTESTYDENNQPPAFKAWMEDKRQELAYIKEKNFQPNNSIKESWNNLMSGGGEIMETSVEPLLKTQWGQGCFYNEKCPVPPISFNCGHSVTGCVATSMAQIMKYWNYPTRGTGSHSYFNIFGTQTADFGSTIYQWSQMPDQVVSPNEAVATLMYHCGVSVDMQYKNNSSGATDPRDELVKYFGYSSDAEYIDKRAFLPNDWVNLLKTELDQGRPIYYEGKPAPCSEGHAFVCDGYQNSNYFHFNWGWDGHYNGYFYLNDLNPGGKSFTNFQNVIIKIFPEKLPDGYQGFYLSTKAVGIGNNGGIRQVRICSSEPWTATCDQPWVTLRKSSGTNGNDSIEISVQPNPTKSSRTANISVSANGFSTQKITVKEYGTTTTTAGNLRTELGTEISSITSLKLEGTIDARDFKLMRDEMPELVDIDLSQVTIVEYNGTKGTIGDGEYDYSYPANAIPNFAFLLNPNLSKFRLQSVVLPENIKSIMDYAFQGCNHLKIEKIPSSVSMISDGAFLDCSTTDVLIIPESVQTIGVGAFQNFRGKIEVNANNPNYSSDEGVLFNKNKTELIQCPSSKSGNYVIPTSVISIGKWAFLNCCNLTSIAIPNSVKKIDGSFQYCTGLKSISIPSSVVSISDRSFDGFIGTINVDVNNAVYSSTDGVLFDKEQTEILFCPVSKTGQYMIPPTVTKIRNNAFLDCNILSSVVIPPFIKKIGSFGFSCNSLTSIYSRMPFPIELSDLAFNQVDKSACILYVPYGSKALYSQANQWEEFINIVEMPGFFVSDNTLSFDMKGGQEQISLSSSSNWLITSDQSWLRFDQTAGAPGFRSVLVTATPNETKTSRKSTITISAEGFTPQKIEVTQYATVEVTAGNLKTALANSLAGIKSLRLSGTIDARDFKIMRDEMPDLVEIDLKNSTIIEYTGPDGTVDGSNYNYYANMIPPQSFRFQNFGNNVLTSVVLPESTKEIGWMAFMGCNALRRLVLSDSVKTIQDAALYNFKGDLVVSNTNPYLTASDGILFNKAKTDLILCFGELTGVYSIPQTVKKIESNAFIYCNKLTGITIPESVSEFGEGIFTYCTNLEFANIPVSANVIPQNTFYYCKKLKSITIPSSISTIKHYAFAGCSGLTSIHACSHTPVNIDYSVSVFSDIDKKTCLLYVPFGSKDLYKSANQWKDFQNIIEDIPPGGSEPEVKSPTTNDVLLKNESFTLAPNPTSGKIKINCSEQLPDQKEVFVTNSQGKMIYKKKIKGNEDWIDLSGYSEGIYFVKIGSDPGIAKKIILSK